VYAGYRDEAADPGVDSVVFVLVKPHLVGLGSGFFGGVRRGIGSFRGQCPVEAFDLAVGLLPIRWRVPVLDDVKGFVEGIRAIAGAEVGHDGLEVDTGLGEERMHSAWRSWAEPRPWALHPPPAGLRLSYLMKP